MNTNGCGAMSGLLRWFKPPHYKFFHTACILHDELYIIGGSEEDRKRADVRLFRDMVRHSVEYFGDRVSAQMWFLVLSYLYYIAVRLFGKSQFNYR